MRLSARGGIVKPDRLARQGETFAKIVPYALMQGLIPSPKSGLFSGDSLANDLRHGHLPRHADARRHRMARAGVSAF
jgi:hypothetical protein